MTIENQLETLIESKDVAVDTDLLEAVRAKMKEKELLDESKKKEEAKEKKDDESGKAAADDQDATPAVTIDNPINPDLNASEGDDDQDEDDQEKQVNEAVKSDDEIDDAHDESIKKKSVKESVEELLGDEFTEDFKLKAVVIFEAAVKDQVVKIEEALKAEYATKAAALQEDFDKKLSEQTAQIEESLSDEVNGYLTLISEEWMSKNELAVRAGIKAELVESFIGGMKTLFEEHYVDLPEEKLDMVGKLEAEKAALTEELANTQSQVQTLTEQHNAALREQIMSESAKDFTVLDFERFKTLTEDFAFENEETFRKKVDIVKTAFFETKAERRTKTELKESFVPSAPIVEEKKLMAEDAPASKTKMDEYIRYISKTK